MSRTREVPFLKLSVIRARSDEQFFFAIFGSSEKNLIEACDKVSLANIYGKDERTQLDLFV